MSAQNIKQGAESEKRNPPLGFPSGWTVFNEDWKPDFVYNGASVDEAPSEANEGGKPMALAWHVLRYLLFGIPRSDNRLL